MKLSVIATSSLAFLGSSGSEAFAPVTPVGTRSTISAQNLRSNHGSPPYATATSLAMKGNLVDRFVRVFNANVNKFVSGLEDPEKVIVQAVDDMQVRKILL